MGISRCEILRRFQIWYSQVEKLPNLAAIPKMVTVSYSKLVWSGVKDLFNIFLCYLNIIFTIFGKEMHPEGKNQHKGSGSQLEFKINKSSVCRHPTLWPLSTLTSNTLSAS
jgi:hypothetical protein